MDTGGCFLPQLSPPGLHRLPQHQERQHRPEQPHSIGPTGAEGDVEAAAFQPYNCPHGQHVRDEDEDGGQYSECRISIEGMIDASNDI